MERPIFVLVGRQRPHHVMLLLFSLMAGLAYLLGFPPPRTVSENLGDPYPTVWSTGLALSGSIGLVGAFWRARIDTGLLLERAAMIIGAGSTFGYAWSVSHGGESAAFAVGFCISWGAANLVLAAQISKDLRNLGRKKTRNARSGQPGGTADRIRNRWWPAGSHPGDSPPPQDKR